METNCQKIFRQKCAFYQKAVLQFNQHSTYLLLLADFAGIAFVTDSPIHLVFSASPDLPSKQATKATKPLSHF